MGGREEKVETMGQSFVLIDVISSALVESVLKSVWGLLSLSVSFLSC